MLWALPLSETISIFNLQPNPLTSSIFFLFYIFPSFLKIYGLRKYFQNCTSIAMWDGGRDLPPCPTAAWARGTVAPTTAVGYGGKGSVYFQKFIVFFV
jgi:hypothetical protein